MPLSCIIAHTLNRLHSHCTLFPKPLHDNPTMENQNFATTSLSHVFFQEFSAWQGHVGMGQHAIAEASTLALTNAMVVVTYPVSQHSHSSISSTSTWTGNFHKICLSTQPFFRFLHLLMDRQLPQNMDLIVFIWGLG